jgi:hypothetical protein
MPELTPVLQAWLAGQDRQSEMIGRAHKFQLDREQLDQAIKEFDILTKQRQQQMKQAAQLLQLNTDIAHQETRDKILKQFQTGERTPGGFQGAPPDINMVTPEGSAPIPGIPRAPQFNPYTTQPVETAFGPMQFENVGTPEKTAARELAANVEQQRQLMPGQLEFARKKADIEADAYVKKQMPIWENRLASAEWIAQLRADNARAIGELNATTKMQMKMFELGFGNEGELMDTAQKHLIAVALGREDQSSIKGPMQKIVSNLIATSGFAVPPGGVKFGNKLNTSVSNLAQFISEFNSIDSEFPATDSKITKGTNYIQAFPGVNRFTELGERFRAHQTNVLKLAGMTGQSLSRSSDKDMGILRSTMALETDSTKARSMKRRQIIGSVLSTVQGEIGHFPLEQRKMFWEDIMRQYGNVFRSDGKMAPVVDKILETGTYTAPGFLSTNAK